MLSCREVTHVVARGELEGTPWRTRLAIRMHLLMCRHCKRYVNQLRRIGDALRTCFVSEAVDPGRLAQLETAVLVRAGLEAGPPSPPSVDPRD